MKSALSRRGGALHGSISRVRQGKKVSPLQRISGPPAAHHVLSQHRPEL